MQLLKVYFLQLLESFVWYLVFRGLTAVIMPLSFTRRRLCWCESLSVPLSGFWQWPSFLILSFSLFELFGAPVIMGKALVISSNKAVTVLKGLRPFLWLKFPIFPFLHAFKMSHIGSWKCLIRNKRIEPPVNLRFL